MLEQSAIPVSYTHLDVYKRQVMEGLGRAILKAYQNDGAIQNVDEENDFLVDRGASTGDSVYISCGIQPVDSAEKYYFTVIAR